LLLCPGSAVKASHRIDLQNRSGLIACAKWRDTTWQTFVAAAAPRHHFFVGADGDSGAAGHVDSPNLPNLEDMADAPPPSYPIERSCANAVRAYSIRP
jgi:hypothetical protein